MSIIPQKIETPSPLAEKFRDLGIDSVTYSHPPLFSVGDGRDFEHLIPGGHTKNLFLKDKKDKLWLVTSLAETRIDLKWLPRRVNAAKLSFGNEALLLEVLGVTPGSVTPLALLNDRARRVTPVLDSRMMECETVNFHPLRNDKTTNITPRGLLAFMRDLGYAPLIVDFHETGEAHADHQP